MPILSRCVRAAVALFFLSIAASLFGQEPWDGPPFSSDPKALIAAAEKVSAGESGVVILLDEARYSFEEDGRARTTWRLVFRIVTDSAVEENDQMTANWAPWYHSKPVLAARVVTKDGTAHTLDANAITEAPAREASLDIFSDNRVVRAPLPALQAGAVVEQLITVDGHSPMAGAGTSSLFARGRWIPVHKARLVLEGPASLEPRVVNKTDIKPVVEVQDGRRRMTFEGGRIEARDDFEGYLPYDVTDYPYIAFSTGESWQAIARQYSEIVDKQIAGAAIEKTARAAIGKATDRREIVTRVLAAIQKDIRYAGVEVGEATIIPRTPETVLRNKYGDCKDKATLLVAMLRAVGLPAHVVLLRAGSDLDIHADLPGLGRFNHAIVRVGSGEDAIWVDPTDEYARAGELPTADQGRMALVAEPSTTTLVRTPETPSTANRYHETRSYALPEHGKPPVVEVTETTGTQEAGQRRWHATTEAKDFRESIESYVKRYYLAKALDKIEASDSRDLTAPFRLTITARESGNGIVEDGEASLALHPYNLFEGIPETLRDWEEPQPNDDPKKSKKRANDFLFPAPLVKEWTYRIVPPAGYVPRTLPKSETRQLGTTTYSAEYSAQPDGVVVAKLRFDSGKRRITAAEYEETRVAVSKFLREPQTNIGFDLTGQAKLNEGDVAGALAEFRKLAALHPKEAQHHIELSRALLAGGLGEAAREEARKALKLEPSNPRAHQMMADALRHDLLGRVHVKGADIPGAITELTKAKELGAELAGRVSLARLLTYNDDGTQYGHGAALKASIEEYRLLAGAFGDRARQFDGELMLVMAHAGRFDELKELAAATADARLRNTGRLLALAATEGAAAALRELNAFDKDTRRAYAGELGQHLLAMRRYPEATAMMEAAIQGTPDASQSAMYIAMFRKARLIETLPPSDDVTDILRKLFLAVTKRDEAAVKALFAPGVWEEQKEDEEDPFAFLSSTKLEGMRPEIVMDLLMAMMQIQKEGNDETGYRLRLRPPDGSDAFSLMVSREDGRYAVRASDDDESAGLAALHFADKGQLEAARTWLNWARENAKTGSSDDPLSGSPFAALWPKAKPTATADEIRIAAAAQVADHDGKTADKLAELREKAGTEERKTAVDRALVRAYAQKHEWAKIIPIARRLAEAHPDSATAFTDLTSALAFTGKSAEAEELARQRLARLPKDRDALRALAFIAASTGDYAAAQKYGQQIIDEVVAEQADFNNAAWYGLFAGNIEQAIEHARRAATGDDKESAPSFHTLATVYAEAGKTLEAREALLASMERRLTSTPSSDDWYVLGRIAETYGVRDAALAAYKKVKKEDPDSPRATVWELAAKALERLK